MDKHRFLHIRCALPFTFPIPAYYDTGSGESTYAGLFPWNPVPVKDVAKILDVQYVPTIASDDPTELMRVRIVPCGTDPQMEVKSDAPLEIALSDPEHALTILDFVNIRNYVGFIVEGFRPRFNV
jgi:hypothetical protein